MHLPEEKRRRGFRQWFGCRPTLLQGRNDAGRVVRWTLEGGIGGPGLSPSALVNQLAEAGFPFSGQLWGVDQGPGRTWHDRHIGPANQLQHSQGVRHVLVAPTVAALDRNAERVDFRRLKQE